MHREAKAEMKKLVQELMVLLMIGVATAGAFAQKPDKGRPPKDPGKVVTPDKRPTPPPNTNRPKPDKKKP